MTAAKAVVQPYLFCEGRCEEALAFYGAVFGARVEMLMRFRDSPEPPADDRCVPGGGQRQCDPASAAGVLQDRAFHGRGERQVGRDVWMTVAEVDALLYLPGHARQQLLRALRIPA